MNLQVPSEGSGSFPFAPRILPGEKSIMLRRISTRLQLAVLCLAALGAAHANAQTLLLCVGSSSTNLLLPDYQNCAADLKSEIESFSFGASVPVSAKPGSGAPGGKPVVSQLNITKRVDALTIPFANSLFKRGFLGSSLSLGFNMTTGPTTSPSNVTITLTGPRVVGFSNGGSSDEPSESVSIAYQTITITDNSTSPPASVTFSGN